MTHVTGLYDWSWKRHERLIYVHTNNYKANGTSAVGAHAGEERIEWAGLDSGWEA
jgi:hypothetical protein